MVHSLSKRDARRVSVRAQLLSSPRPHELVDLVRHLTFLQVDLTAAVAPSAELVCWSRLGTAFVRDDLEDAREHWDLVELRGLLRPADDIPLYRAAMREWPMPDAPAWEHSQAEWVDANRSCRDDILQRLQAEGPLAAREIPDTTVVSWKSSGWTNDRNVGQLLELMSKSGDVAVSHRDGRERIWDLADRVYPDIPDIPESEARLTRDQRRLTSLGVVRDRSPQYAVEPADVGAAGEPATIEGVRGRWRVDPAFLDGSFKPRTALLSPLDRLVFDRARMSDVFDFDYQLEMYKPKAKRRWGFFALPILHGDQLIGKVDATTDLAAGVLYVDAVHEDAPFSATARTAVERELRGLASLLDVEIVRDAKRDD